MDFVFGTYNLEEGGIDDGDTTRLVRQLRRLARRRATGWALQEWPGDTDSILYTAEEILGMRGFIAASTKNPRGSVAVFVNTRDFPVKVTGTRHEGMMHDEKVPYWHALAVVYTDIMGFGPLRLASGHLAPSSPEKRAEEAEYIGLTAEKPIPLIFGADCNAYALNEPARDTTGVPEAKARRKQDLRAAAYLAEYMTDTGQYTGDETPTVGHTRNDKLAYICDRIYTTLPEETITDHEVVTDEDEDSDHRKAITTFRLDTGH